MRGRELAVLEWALRVQVVLDGGKLGLCASKLQVKYHAWVIIIMNVITHVRNETSGLLDCILQIDEVIRLVRGRFDL